MRDVTSHSMLPSILCWNRGHVSPAPVNSIRCGLTPQRIGCACSSSSATVVKVKLSGLDPFPFYCEDGTWPMPLVKFSASNLVTSIANLKVKVSFGVRMDAIVAVQWCKVGLGGISPWCFHGPSLRISELRYGSTVRSYQEFNPAELLTMSFKARKVVNPKNLIRKEKHFVLDNVELSIYSFRPW